MTCIADIPALLQLTEVEPDRFRNRYNQSNVSRGIFGGQLIAQALAAADRTVDGRAVHSLHSYFLRAGDSSKPIDFHVERVRDGGRFSNRRVVAAQGDSELLTMDCSYRTPIAGYSHQRRSPITFAPDAALRSADVVDLIASDGRRYPDLFVDRYPLELRIPETSGFFETADDPKRHYWLRAHGADAVEDPAAHRQILAFMSDFMLAGVPLVPHTIALPGPHLFIASLDHCMWFHRDARCDDWLLFETDSPNAEDGVNLARGFVYDRQGCLVASMMQEALQFGVEADASLR